MKWRLHKPRVWRTSTSVVLATVCPEDWPSWGPAKAWILTVDTLARETRTEVARALRPTRKQAFAVAEVLVPLIDEQTRQARGQSQCR